MNQIGKAVKREFLRGASAPLFFYSPFPAGRGIKGDGDYCAIIKKAEVLHEISLENVAGFTGTNGVYFNSFL
jgi:hypothetical protein